MADLDFSAMIGLRECVRASAFCTEAIGVFQKACVAHDWPTAEEAREVIMASMENHLDSFMSAHRAFQGIGR